MREVELKQMMPGEAVGVHDGDLVALKEEILQFGQVTKLVRPDELEAIAAQIEVLDLADLLVHGGL